MARNDLIIFILSYNRYDNIVTIDMLRSIGYTGNIVILTEESQKQLYEERWGDKEGVSVEAYSKDEMYKITDMADTEHGGTIVLARNYCFTLAKKLGYRYFLEYEDDYGGIFYRYPKLENGFWVLKAVKLKRFDDIIDAFIKFYDSTDATTICFAQGGDYIGGVEKYNQWGNKFRKAMNSFLCRVDRPFKFYGRMNDDVNSYITEGHRGRLYLTIKDISVNQMQTQENEGGLSDMYKKYGTYVKSFYSIIYNPSVAKISMMGWKHPRVHHKILFLNCAPRIIPEEFKKSNNDITPIYKEVGFRENDRL